MARASQAATNPALPIVRPTSLAQHRRSRLAVQPRAALAVAAMLALALLTASLLPRLGLSVVGQAAASLAPFHTSNTSSTPARPVRYALDTQYTSATTAMATAGWLVYSASDASGGSMVMAENRQSKRTTHLLSTALPAAITLRGVTNRWAIWNTGAGTSDAAWTLSASALPTSNIGNTSTAPLTVVDSAAPSEDTLTTLGGVWTNGDTVLLAGTSASGAGLVERVDLSSGTPATHIIARGAPGHLLTDPSLDAGTYYWADVWSDSATGLHSTIWRGDESGHSAALSNDQGAFHPVAANGTLVWVEVAPELLATMTPPAQGSGPDGDEALLNQLNGSLQARQLANGRQWQISARADVTSLQGAGPLLLWRSDSHLHAYDLRTHTAPSVDAQLGDAALADVSGTVLAWEQATTPAVYVYDAR